MARKCALMRTDILAPTGRPGAAERTARAAVTAYAVPRRPRKSFARRARLTVHNGAKRAQLHGLTWIWVHEAEKRCGYVAEAWRHQQATQISSTGCLAMRNVFGFTATVPAETALCKRLQERVFTYLRTFVTPKRPDFSHVYLTAF